MKRIGSQGEEERWVASSVPTQININTMRQKFIYLLIECVQYKLLECSLSIVNCYSMDTTHTRNTTACAHMNVATKNLSN